jgi:type IX secretion system PorP/SprF family membrane protein
MKFLVNLILFFFLFNSSLVQGQDVHHSQFYAFDHFLNPAQIGAHDGDMKLSGIYRSQWKQINGEPITTTGVSFDKAFHYYSHEIDGGIMVVRDLFSGFNTATNKFLLSAAYGMKKFSSNWRFGVQAGLVSNSTNLDVQTFPNQWDYGAGEFDESLPNGEVNIRPSQIYLDVNMGITWSKQLNKVKLTSGFAINHINRPKDTYFNQVAQRRKSKYVFHTMAEYPINPNLALEPKVYWTWTAKANELLLGSNVRYKATATSTTSFYAGAFYRHGVARSFDAIYPVLGAVYKAFDIGLSYDFNVSDLKTGIKRPGTFEVSLSYVLPNSKVKYKIVPCDRY